MLIILIMFIALDRNNNLSTKNACCEKCCEVKWREFYDGKIFTYVYAYALSIYCIHMHMHFLTSTQIQQQNPPLEHSPHSHLFELVNTTQEGDEGHLTV